MQPTEYIRMRQVEDHHWWYAILRHLVVKALYKHHNLPHALVLDAGCGTGGMLDSLRRARPGWKLHGVDRELEAVAMCHQRGHIAVVQGDVCHLPYANDVFDIVLSLDVLYHEKVDQALALREMHRVLRPGGCMVFNLAAFECLRGTHDVAVCGARRYSACNVRKLLECHSLHPEMIHYWNAWLFTPLFFWRRLSQLANNQVCGGDLSVLPSWINFILTIAGKIDAWGCRTLSIPFGTSIFAVAVKQSGRLRSE